MKSGPDIELTSKPASGPSPSPANTIHLRLLATSDLHAHLLPYDYYVGAATDRLGFARTASLIQAARAEARNCLLFDNGDFLQGSALGDCFARIDKLPINGCHPVLAAMNALHYDAGTLGNHEFNYGLDFLTQSLAGADFPIVSANVQQTTGQMPGQPLVPPYTILSRTVVDDDNKAHPIRIGVIGFTPPQIMTWDHRHLNGKLSTRQIVEAALDIVPQMQRDGADLIVALSHSGIGAAQASEGMENASTALAGVNGIDAVITGHSHLVFPSDDFAPSTEIDPVLGTLCRKPAVMPGLYGSHLGVIDLYLSRKAESYQVIRHRSEARPIWQRQTPGTGTALVTSHPDVLKTADAAHRETLAWTTQTVGSTEVPLHSYFSLLMEAPALQLVAAAQAQFVTRALASTDLANVTVLSSVAPFKAGGRSGPENYTDVPVGDVLLRHAVDLYALPNTSAAVRLTGAEIADWLEYAVGIFHQIAQDSVDADLINPAFPSFNFDMIFGLSFQIDLSKPARFDQRGTLINSESHRILDLSFQGQAFDPGMEFIVASNSYRISANAGGLFPADGRVIFESTKTNLDAVMAYLAAAPHRAPAVPPGRRFASQRGTTVTFETSPKAVDHMSELAGLNIEAIGLAKSGFLRLRLYL